MPRRRLAATFALLLAATPAQAGSIGPADIRQAAEALRQSCHLADWSGPRATLSHQLWRWLDRELASAPEALDTAALERRLDDARLPADGSCAQFAGETDQFGQVGLELRRVGEHLEARVTIGLTCGQDQTAALYRHDGRGWRRYWRSGPGSTPMTLATLATAPHAPGGPLVLALERGGDCTSLWRPVRLQLWRAGPNRPQHLLLDHDDFAYWDGKDGNLAARLDGADLYVEAMVASVDVGILARRALRRYRVDGDRVHRLDPIALSPADFIEEWLSGAWAASAPWTEAAGRDAARRWHAALRGRNGAPSLSGEFTGNALRCRRDPSLWQVSMNFADAPPRHRAVAFLVRWTAAYRFRLVAVRHRPWPDCTEDADPAGRDRRLLRDGQAPR